MKLIFFTTFKKIKRARRVSQLLILTSFLITFVLIRVVTHLQRANILPDQSDIFSSFVHIHHLVPGIFLILISGYIGISFWNITKMRWLMSILFGMGTALTIDEFALWLFLKDVYWAKQGRDSIDAVIIVAILLLIAFAVSEFRGQRNLRNIVKEVKNEIRHP